MNPNNSNLPPPKDPHLTDSGVVPPAGAFSDHHTRRNLKQWLSLSGITRQITHYHLRKGFAAGMLIGTAYVLVISSLIAGAFFILDYSTHYKVSETIVKTAKKIVGIEDKQQGGQGGGGGSGNGQGGGSGGGQTSSSVLTVSGNRILKDGQPFLVRGFNMRGLLAAPFCDNPSSNEASEHFGEAELTAAKNWNANTLRFQVSQPGLSRPDLPAGDYDLYINTILIPRIKLTLERGFTVIVSMQTQKRSCGPGIWQPNQDTLDSWSRLVPKLKSALSDKQFSNVMFELLNEPRGEPTAEGWKQWLEGGDSPVGLENTNGKIAVGHQAVVNTIRATGGTNNVLLAEGLRLGRRLGGIPMLSDPSGHDQIAYAFHGYGYNDNGEYEADKARWENDFGSLAATKAVVMTEWHYGANECDEYGETLAPLFMKYLNEKNIGTTPGPFDGADGTGLIYDWKWTPTDCEKTIQKQRGGGQFVKNYYNYLAGKGPAVW